MDVKGQINADIQARGAMDKPALNGQLSARNLDISGKEIPQPVKVNDITLALTPETVRSNEFAATTGSTTVNVSFALSQYSAPNSSISATSARPECSHRRADQHRQGRGSIGGGWNVRRWNTYA